jgi:hypothetical protein
LEKARTSRPHLANIESTRLAASTEVRKDEDTLGV